MPRSPDAAATAAVDVIVRASNRGLLLARKSAEARALELETLETHDSPPPQGYAPRLDLAFGTKNPGWNIGTEHMDG